MISIGLQAVLPEAILALLILGLVLLEAVFTPRHQPESSGWVALLGVLLALAVALARWDSGASGELGNAVLANHWSMLFDILFLTQAALVTLLGMAPGPGRGFEGGERHVLVLAATLGMMVAVGAADLILLLLGLGLAAMSGQVLAGLSSSAASQRAAARHSLHGALAAGFCLFGVGLVYGATGSSDLGELSQALLSSAAPTGPAPAGLVLILVGMSYWALAAPGHWWALAAIQETPIHIGVLLVVMATAPLAAGARMLMLGFSALQDQWSTLVWMAAALTMALGGLLAVNERDLKRMLAAVSIAQIGGALMGMATGTREGLAATALQLAALPIAMLGLGAAMRMCRVQTGQAIDIGDWAGLGRRRPLLGMAVALFLLTLAGLPPTAGFAARIMLIQAGAQSGMGGLVAVALLGQIPVVYVCVKVLAGAFAGPAPAAKLDILISPPAAAVAALAACVLLGLGLQPEPLAGLCRLAARSLF